MPAYQVRVHDRAGALLAVTPEFRTLNVEHIVNNVSTLTLGVTDVDDNSITRCLDEDAANLDNIIEIRRSAPEYGIGWYTEYIGFHRTAQRQLTSEDQQILTSYSRGLLDLIKRRSIRHYADTAGSAKGPGPADDIIKEFVYENAGAGATLGGGPVPGRVTAGVTPGLTIAPNLSQAPMHESANAWQNLLAAIAGMAGVHSVDFDVLRTGAATFEFRTYYPRMGTDRTLGTSNPVVLAPTFGNATNLSRTLSRTEEVSSALVLGPGEGPLRDTTLRTSSHTGDSPWNLIEEDINASNEDRAVALEQVGDDLLHEKRPAVSYAFDVIQTPQSAYGKHYFLGDLVTARFKTFTDSLKIRGVRLNVSDNRETVSLTLEEVP